MKKTSFFLRLFFYMCCQVMFSLAAGPDNPTNYDAVPKPCLMAPDIVHKLYQMMKDIHEILEENNVTYWMHAGTLLGAVRHQGHIPWDDDADIVIPIDQEQKFVQLKQVFEQYGYELSGPYAWGYKILLNNQHSVNKQSASDLTLDIDDNDNYNAINKWFVDVDQPWIDVMIFADIDEKYVYDPVRNNPPFLPHIFFDKKDLFPLKKYTFGECQLMGPNNPIPYLDLTYPDWRDYVHLKGGIKIPLNDKLTVPAQPTGPLKDRVILANKIKLRQLVNETLTIEPATLAHADAISELITQLGFPQNSNDLCLKKIELFNQSSLDKIWVAVMQEKVVGFLALNIVTPFYHDGLFARVDTIVVDEAYRHCGIGKALMQRAEEYAQSVGCDRMFLTSGNHRIGAHEFYKHIGYASNATYFVKNFKKNIFDL